MGGGVAAWRGELGGGCGLVGGVYAAGGGGGGGAVGWLVVGCALVGGVYVCIYVWGKHAVFNTCNTSSHTPTHPSASHAPVPEQAGARKGVQGQ